jgi:hypothetical protein
MILAPSLTKQPELTPENRLHLIGEFPTQPLKVQFELFFLSIDGVWRIEGMAVYAVPPAGAALTGAAPAAAWAASAKPAKGEWSARRSDPREAQRANLGRLRRPKAASPDVPLKARTFGRRYKHISAAVLNIGTRTRPDFSNPAECSLDPDQSSLLNPHVLLLTWGNVPALSGRRRV